MYTVESWVSLMSRHQIGRLTKGASAVALATFVLQVMVALPAGAANVAGAATTVAAVTLPSLGDVAGYNPALHIFAMSLG